MGDSDSLAKITQHRHRSYSDAHDKVPFELGKIPILPDGVQRKLFPQVLLLLAGPQDVVNVFVAQNALQPSGHFRAGNGGRAHLPVCTKAP